MFNQVISDADPPVTLSSDNDPLFKSHRWQANLRILDVDEVKPIPIHQCPTLLLSGSFGQSGENISTTFLSGILSIWIENSTSSKITTTTIALYSVLETAKANGHNPQRYLSVLLTELPNATTIEQVEVLLPWEAKPRGGKPPLRVVPSAVIDAFVSQARRGQDWAASTAYT